MFASDLVSQVLKEKKSQTFYSSAVLVPQLKFTTTTVQHLGIGDKPTYVNLFTKILLFNLHDNSKWLEKSYSTMWAHQEYCEVSNSKK